MKTKPKSKVPTVREAAMKLYQCKELCAEKLYPDTESCDCGADNKRDGYIAGARAALAGKVRK